MKGFHWALLFPLLGACAFDPTQTTTLVGYPTPLVNAVSLAPSQAAVQVQSWVVSVDFIRYNIYLADAPWELTNVHNVDPNDYDNLSLKPHLKASVAFTAQANGSQYALATIGGLATGHRYWAVVTCLGSNQLLGSLRTNRGLFESGPSVPWEITPRPEAGFSLTNFFFTNSGSALDFDGTNLSQTSPAGPWSAVSSLVVSIVGQTAGVYYPALAVGPNSAGQIQAKGSPADWNTSMEIPTTGWASAGSVFPVAVGNLFFVRMSNVNVKIMVTNVSGTVSSTNSPIILGGVMAWQTNQFATRL